MGRKMMGDTLINMVASFLPVGILQLVVLPMLAGGLSAQEYGLCVTLVGLMTMVASVFGNSLNNAHLLMHKDYEEAGVQGDFPVLLLISTGLSVVIMAAGLIFYQVPLLSAMGALLLMSAILLLWREYYMVDFRLELHYGKILVSNGLLTVGYLLGLWIFRQGRPWPFVYLVGYFLSVGFIVVVGTLPRHPLQVTPLFGETVRTTATLTLNTFLQSSLNYIDRLLIYPLLGGYWVSIYYTSTLFGKIVSMGMAPITSVFLSYFTKMEKEPEQGFKWTLLAATGIGVLGYGAAMLLAQPVLGWLYPQWVDAAMVFIPVTTATAMVTMVASVIHPFVLSFRPTHFQLVISGTSLAVYLPVVLLLHRSYGLMGFCVGVLVANVVRVLMMIGVYFSLGKEK